ncbi:MAG: signal peptidase I [Candidatus Pacebacteria bacterium]|nr:signal peptidase I [Candidatus Paceibacterota bacterium]
MNETLHTNDALAEKKSRAGSFLSELIRFALITLFIVLPIRIYIAQPFIVSGSSMDPTFESGEYLIVDELSYRLRPPERGDVIIFRFPHDTSKFFIKRIIGLPNETVAVNGQEVTIENAEHPEGFILDESYVTHETFGTLRSTLGDDEYFVMGDNRPASSDSRIWGTLKKDLIIGRALIRLLPVSEASLLPGKHRYADGEGDASLDTERSPLE